MSFELKYLFSDIRSLISFIKENHGGIFRKIAFSSMLEPYIKIKQENHLKTMRIKKIDSKLNEIKEWQKKIENDSDHILNGYNDTESISESMERFFQIQILIYLFKFYNVIQ